MLLDFLIDRVGIAVKGYLIVYDSTKVLIRLSAKIYAHVLGFCHI